MARKVDDGIEGAQAERDAIRKYLRRLLKDYEHSEHYSESEQLAATTAAMAIDRILGYLDGRTKRYNASPGGVEGKRASKGAKGTKGKGKP